MSIVEVLQRRGAYHGRLKQMVDDGTIFQMEENGDKDPESVWQGSFRLFGVDVLCHVLSDGRRIIEADCMKALLEAMANGIKVGPGDLEAFARWQRGEAEKGSGMRLLSPSRGFDHDGHSPVGPRVPFSGPQTHFDGRRRQRGGRRFFCRKSP